MKTAQNGAAWLIFVVLLAGIACRLTSPTPAAWSKTPTAQAQAATNTAEAMLRRATFVSGGETLSTPFPTETAQITREPQTQPVQSDEGPWLVYAAKETGILRAYDIGMGKVIEINLPTPIYIEDLIQGHYPGDRYLFIRAGSPLITDELALYQVDLLSNEIKKISPLLSISLQRRIVNQLGTRALETLQAVTQPNGLAWSRDRHFLAFTAALHNDSSDLYVFDTTHDRLQRLNGLFTQNATPFWSPENTWLISQELGNYDPERGWRAENVSGLRIPAFDDQNSLYLPGRESRGKYL